MDDSLANSADPGSISSTLLEQAKNLEPAAWGRLVHLYGPLVYRWCRQRGLQAADATDVVQETFRSLAAGLTRFHREQSGDSFRGWLWTVAQNKVRDHFRGRAGYPVAVGGTDMQQQLAAVPDAPPPTTDSFADREADVGLAHRAMEAIRGEFEDSTWAAFWRMTVLGESSAQVAADLGMNKSAVRQAKYRILRRLRQELG
jgi:RNA polymerase sigma-70 factor (ECF subfamily)